MQRTFKSNIFILSIFGISEVSKFKKSKVYTAKSAKNVLNVWEKIFLEKDDLVSIHYVKQNKVTFVFLSKYMID